jgi:hypothetical protein
MYTYPVADSLQQFLLFGLISIIAASIILFYVQRYERKRLAAMESPETEHELNMNEMDQAVRNLPKFWIRSRVVTVSVSFALIVFGPFYFWSVPDTPQSDLAAGLGLLLFGVFLDGICLVSFALEQEEAMRKLGIKRPKKRF